MMCYLKKPQKDLLSVAGRASECEKSGRTGRNSSVTVFVLCRKDGDIHIYEGEIILKEELF